MIFKSKKEKKQQKKQEQEQKLQGIEKVNKLSYEVSKSFLPPEREFDTAQKNIWFVLINPERAIEVRAWLTKNKMKALLMRGEHGETMLHWAVLSEYGLIVDLIDAGLGVNIKDKYGKTPMDWLLERYWYSCVVNDTSLNKEGYLKIKGQTEDLGTVLWSLGGRPSENNENALEAKLIAARGALWWYIQALKETEGVESLKNWSNGRCVLHAWILSENNDQKVSRIKRMLEWGVSIDEPDENGRTCLWYALDTWERDLEVDLMLNIIPELLELGADPDIEDNFNISPRNLLSEEKAEKFEEIIKEKSIH